MEVLCVIGVLILIFSSIVQSGTDEKFKRRNYEHATRYNNLVYYDNAKKCYRSMKTNQKAALYQARDINGDLYEYVVTVPLFKTEMTGDFIEARYVNPKRWNEAVQFDEYHRNLFFGGKC